MEFEWEPGRGGANTVKHGVSFEEARSTFDDPLFLAFAEPDHSDHELRFILLGQSNQGQLLVVSYPERATGIRVISARLATRSERNAYE